jgi:FkbM family methyltransferase
MNNHYIKDSVEKDLACIRASERPVLVWGAGWAASLALRFLKAHGVRVADVVVDVETAIHEDIIEHNLVPLSPERAAIKYSKASVVCGFYTNKIYEDFANKIKHLKKLGVDATAYAFDLHIMMYPERRYTIDFVQSNLPAFESLSETLRDELSRETLTAFIQQRVSGKYGPIEPLVVPHQYFTTTVYNLHDQEVFVDCGAYDGDTIRDFIDGVERSTGNRVFRRIYAFEPNKEPLAKLTDCYGSLDSFVLVGKGVWNQKEALRFSSDRLRSSKVSDSGDVEIILDCLDNMIPHSKPTLIKMDVEGAELAALHGARKLISQHAPRIAVCVYHKNDDLITIPNFIKSLDIPYRLYLRAHESKASELVLYGIPKCAA